MTTSGPISRARSVGKLSTSSPSTYKLSPSRTGAKIPGSDMVDLIARPIGPVENTCAFPETKSVATQRKGIGRSSNDFTSE